ncbi:hypothetical protein FB567DRAFT_587888 [Paraphoma chrysanthemicola]|uniref:Uncharacterized protein n=1 Tax=Paraphoma chrysanthemicola TaxID=798071 RepID=A0A8K0RIA1_9PLEO|nr:hypothetical protein FB567DRAFT_587888 [Paraphoma chrysanthemicola]
MSTARAEISSPSMLIDDAGPTQSSPVEELSIDLSIRLAILLLSTQEDLAWPATPPRRKKSKRQAQPPQEPPTPPKTPPTARDTDAADMADKTKDTVNNTLGNAPGGRGDVGDTLGGLTQAPKGLAGGGEKEKDKDANAAFGLDNKDKDVKGSLKVHIKLDLEADIRIIARIKGDIAIGLL